MHVVVVGAGIVGLASAFKLQERGCRVTVLDAAQPGGGASHANGAQLSYSHVAPLAGPGVLHDLPGLLWSRRAPLALRLRADFAQWRWLLQFLAACNARTAQATSKQLFALAAHSRAQVDAFLNAHPDQATDCDYRMAGKLVAYANQRDFARASAQAAALRALGSDQEVLPAAECLVREPALAGDGQALAGGVFSARDAVVDSLSLCEALAGLIVGRGGSVRQATQVSSWSNRSDDLVAILANGETVSADAFVVCAGTGSRRLLHPLGLRIPVRPLKGYSVTFALREIARAPRLSITDYSRKMVFAPLGGRLRVAGFVEIGTAAEHMDGHRIRALVDATQARFGFTGKAPGFDTWAGQRPATPTGLPIISATPQRKLFINTGHGALGVTLAMGSADLAAALVTGAVAPVDPGPFQLVAG